MTTSGDRLENKLDDLIATCGDIQGDVRVLRHNYNNLKQSTLLYQEQHTSMVSRMSAVETRMTDHAKFITTVRRVVWIVVTLAIPTLASLAVYFPRLKV